MTIRVETGRRPGSPNKPIQNRIVVLDHATAVLDDTSSWAPQERDGRSYADLLADELAHCLQRPGDPPLTVHLADAIRGVVAGASRDGRPLVPGEDPSAAVLVCRWTDDTIEVLARGDSTAIVYTRDGRAHPVRDDRFDRLIAERRAVIEAAGAVGHEDHTRLIAELQDVQRAAGSRLGGYGSSGADSAAAREAVVRSWRRLDVDAVLLMTGGVADVVDRFAVNDFPHWHNIFDLVAADGVQALVDHVHAVADTHPDGRRSPRSKAHDDKAAVLVMTETYESRTRLEPPFSTLAAADRAMERGDYAVAIDLYASVSAALSAAARDPSDEDLAHSIYSSHVGWIDALARAGRLDELAALATNDSQARRRLDRQLHEEGRADELRTRAVGGDRTALYLLIRLLRSRGDDDAARRAVEDIAPDNEHARQLLFDSHDD